MSQKPSEALAKPETAAVAEQQSESAPRSRLSWAVGWVLVPTAVVGVIFGSGVAVGVHLYSSWFTAMIVWIVELFV